MDGPRIKKESVATLIEKYAKEILYDEGKSTVFKMVKKDVLGHENQLILKLQDCPPPITARLSKIYNSIVRKNLPGIPPIYNFGKCKYENFTFYIIQEYVKGMTFKEVCEKRSPEEKMRFLLKLISNVEELHRHGFVHNDLKPLNLIFKDDPYDYDVYIIDYDLVHNETEGIPFLPGWFYGTAHYVSPDRVSGNVTDMKSDQCAIGLLACGLLADLKPFENCPEGYAKYARDEQKWNRIIRGLPIDNQRLRQVLQRSLAYKKKDRYASVSSLANVLKQIDLNDHHEKVHVFSR